MIFNSLEFLFFLPIVFLLIWFVFNKQLKSQNALLLVASYVFYGWWDWRFLSLIIISSTIDYFVGIKLEEIVDKKIRRRLISLSLFSNLGILSLFKYFNFFIDSFIETFSYFGLELHATSLRIILPVGISFYTFQTLSYSIDIYNRKAESTRDIVAFFAFVSFFPQLVAGPIERSKNLLPQFINERKFDYHTATDGMRQILWGFLKKLVIADNAAEIANKVFSNHTEYSGLILIFAAICFSFQIYGDFSGYSDIAIGTAKLFGIRLKTNFSYPYFSKNIQEFWRNWHISLSTWFRDYIYIPIGGSRRSNTKVARNLLLVFTISGLWHGANWTFIFWGFLHGVCFVLFFLYNKNKSLEPKPVKNKNWQSITEFMQIGITFSIVTLFWIFFRSDSISEAFSYISRIFTFNLETLGLVKPKLVILILAMLIFEWFNKKHEHPLVSVRLIKSKAIRWTFYIAFIFFIIWNAGQGQEFIYFQF